MNYALQNIETGDIVKTFASMREFLNDFPKGLDEDNRKLSELSIYNKDNLTIPIYDNSIQDTTTTKENYNA